MKLSKSRVWKLEKKLGIERNELNLLLGLLGSDYSSWYLMRSKMSLSCVVDWFSYVLIDGCSMFS